MKNRISHRNAGLAWSAVDSANIVEMIRESCERDSSRPILIFEDGLEVTRGEFLRRVESFAGYLRNRVAPGDRVAIMLPNRAEFMIAWIATVANRAVLVSVNPGAGEYDAAHILGESQPVVAIAGQDQAGLIEKLRPSLPSLQEVIRVGDAEPDGLQAYGRQEQKFPLSEAKVSRYDITNLYYTSGTTGLPKGCMLDHEYWLRFVDLYLRLYGMSADDRLLCCLQFFYGDPPWQFLSSLKAGSSLVVMRRFSVSRFWRVVRDNDVTQLFTIASIPNLLLRAAPTPVERKHRVKFALHIGISAHLHADMVQRWGFPWVEGYGLTEVGLVVSMPIEFAKAMTGSGSVGLPCPEVAIRIVDEHRRDVPTGMVGEILVRAPGVMRGYLNRPEATTLTLRGGWVYSGDLGRIDERGFLYFLGRKKDVIRRGGENVAAVEVERVLRSHPKVLDAAVIPVPDEVRGEEIKAYILLVPDEDPDRVPPEEIVAFCARNLARYKLPRYIEYRTTEFPRTPSMRIKKEELLKEREHVSEELWDRMQELGW
jgi:crotonobetaine/carnitine-CoA ligase